MAKDKDTKKADAPQAMILEREGEKCHPAYRTAGRLLFTQENGLPLEVPVGQHFVPDNPDQAKVLADLELPEGFRWGDGDIRALGPGAGWGTGSFRAWTPNDPRGAMAAPSSAGVASSSAPAQTAAGAPAPSGSSGVGSTSTTGTTATTGSTAAGAPAPSGSSGTAGSSTSSSS